MRDAEDSSSHSERVQVLQLVETPVQPNSHASRENSLGFLGLLLQRWLKDEQGNIGWR